ncbi:MAG: alpha/beta hydrolase [Gammaproteobacteria bacterium]|nr:alpha/beta hydrolase [Gammaproteobacteria bacterium]MBQ0839420.1 alpha/beta hydrolase [Gammaproteobacteria bacterium]
MFKRLTIIGLWVTGLALNASGVIASEALAKAQYPIEDRFAATVIGTPHAYKAELPAEIPVKEYTLPGLHPVPKLFWYSEGLRFSAALQKGRAPLVFNIAGTGAGYKSQKMLALQKALYQAGFHVINISSPTYLNFLINASQSNLPGFLPEDAKDIYRVMEQAYKQIEGDVEVSAFHIMGYSLGAAHAAFVAELDQRRKVFDLQKVYMINPPVNLYHSVDIFDHMLEANVEGGLQGVGVFLDRALNRLAASYEPKEGMHFDGDFLYKAYSSWDLSKRGTGPEGRNGAAALIATSFRLSSANIVFAADLMSHSAYIIPPGTEFGRRERLDYYAKASHVVKFTEYVDDMIIPYLQQKQPDKSREQLLKEASLHHIEAFMAGNAQLRVVTNRDEIILAPGELAYMEGLLGERIKVFAHGGHCGNIDSKENVADMVAFLKGEKS